jgi:hypothetical protein
VVAGRTLYERTRALLAERGFVEEEARYDEEAFGSWLIAVDHRPRLQILWDGRDAWLIIQGELLRVRPDSLRSSAAVERSSSDYSPGCSSPCCSDRRRAKFAERQRERFGDRRAGWTLATAIAASADSPKRKTEGGLSAAL